MIGRMCDTGMVFLLYAFEYAFLVHWVWPRLYRSIDRHACQALEDVSFYAGQPCSAAASHL